MRDGDRARRIAQSLVDERRSLSHIVTLAMASAEAGDFDAALQWQRSAIAAAERAGRTELLAELNANERRYRASQACRRPWHPDDPVLAPRPLGR